jgi:putative cardiolipin synthase
MVRRGVFLLFFILLVGCASLPRDIPKDTSQALQASDTTILGKMVAVRQEEHPGLSGFYLLPSGMADFVSRVLLVDAAEKTLDLQYYIVSEGLTVDLLMERLIRAAMRGVRVRLLFDDLGVGLTDEQLSLLDNHPNIEVRLFNPVPERRRGLVSFFSFLGNLKQLNHRMHNKAFIVDNTVAIVGGRNLADEYFGAAEAWNFADMGMLAIGPVVRDLSKSFDTYWNCEWSVPYAYFSKQRPSKEEAERAFADLEAKNRDAEDSRYVRSLRDTPYLKRLMTGETSWSWATSSVVYDLPEKISGEDKSKDAEVYLGTQLVPLVDGTKSELTLVSPYFIPGQEGLQTMRALRERGVRIRILTNSLASTDVPSVHAGYIRYRKDLLDAGVEIYEMRPDESGEKARDERRRFLGSSRGGLHAKIYVFDRRSVFVGSRNLDPRSNLINTEVGIVVDSPEIAETISQAFDTMTSPRYAFKVTLSSAGRVIWQTETDGKEVTYRKEPLTSLWKRLSLRLMSVLLPESML